MSYYRNVKAKLGKSSRLDSLRVEHFVYSHISAAVLLPLLFRRIC